MISGLVKPRRTPLYSKIQFVWTNHPITLWVGAILLRLYFELIALYAILAPVSAPFAKHSPSQITTLDVLQAWFVWAGVVGRVFRPISSRPLADALNEPVPFPFAEILQRFFQIFHAPIAHRAFGSSDTFSLDATFDFKYHYDAVLFAL